MCENTNAVYCRHGVAKIINTAAETLIFLKQPILSLPFNSAIILIFQISENYQDTVNYRIAQNLWASKEKY